MTEDPNPRSWDSMALGITLLVSFDIVIGFIGSHIVDRVWGGYATLNFLFLFGIWHASWGLPLALTLHLLRLPRAMRGVLVTLGITFLLTSACYGLMAVVG